MSKHAMVMIKFCHFRAKCLKSKSGNSKRSLVLFFCFLFSVPAYATLSVSVTGGAWTIGSAVPGAIKTTTGDTWTATNDGNGTSNISIKVDGTTWHPGSTAAAETFVLKHDASGSWSSDITNTGNGISLTTNLAASGTKPFDLQFTAPTSSAVEGTQQTLTVTLTVSVACGYDFEVAHTDAGAVAPIDKTVTYGTVLTNLTGSDKCWITQNLGADRQALSSDDDTELSAGWYWQFNHKQGYKYTESRIPDTSWLTAINQTTDWTEANDPCFLLLGAGWRLPTETEWINADGAPQNWASKTDTYNSVLKLHAAGYIVSFSGLLDNRGSGGRYWSSDKLTASDTTAYALVFALYSSIGNSAMSYGNTVRCLMD